MSTAYYSVIQFCPDAARQEAVNVGVVLFDPKTGYVGVKFTPTLDRIHKFFGKGTLDAGQLKVLGESVQLMLRREKALLASPDTFATFADGQVNELRFTPPRKIGLGHSQNVLDAVFQRLVGARPSGRDSHRLTSRLRREFDTPDLRRRVQRSVEIAVVRSPQPIRAPFGYQNGVFNLIQPATFSADDGSELMKRTGYYHLEGKLLRGTNHPEYGRLGLVVVGEVKGAKRRDAERFISEELEQERVAFYSIDRLEELIEEIRRNAKIFSPPNMQRFIDEVGETS